tara:strand:- start:184 stop:471 length:288 start_codon:yes stop_codon:yes gene_type:complete
MKKSDVFRLTFSDFSDRLIPVSERNTMKNTMTMTEIRKHMADKRKREAKTRENLKRIGEAAALRAESLDHRGRSNDDCPLIIGLQNKVKELQNKG